jgi:predicted membrane channel-forming protein YqfA (hemolysin III family)
MVNLYGMSTAQSTKQALRYGDHISIYCLIAGSSTAFTLMAMGDQVLEISSVATSDFF